MAAGSLDRATLVTAQAAARKSSPATRSHHSTAAPTPTSSAASISDPTRPTSSGPGTAKPEEHGGYGEHGKREEHPGRQQPGRGQHGADRRHRVAGPHQHAALHHATGRRAAGHHPARGVARQLRHGHHEPGLGAQRDPQQRPQRHEAGQLRDGHHEEPDRADVTQARHGVEQREQAGRDDVQRDAGDGQSGAAGQQPAPPPRAVRLLAHAARISATSARTSAGSNSSVASPTVSSTTCQPGSSLVKVFGQVHSARSVAIRRIAASIRSASPRR